MKKLITILMLAVAIIAGGASVEAKTTKKSKAKTSQTASKSSLNFKTILGTINNLNYNYSQFSKNLSSTMAKLGFAKEKEFKTYVEQESIEGDETWKADAKGLSFLKGGTSVVYKVFDYSFRQHVPEIEIKFGSSSELNNFISASKTALGSSFKKSPYTSNGYVYHNWSIKEKGKSLICKFNEEE